MTRQRAESKQPLARETAATGETMMTPAQIAAAIRSGESVAAIAERIGVSPSIIYRRLKSAGTPIASLRTKERGHVEYRELDDWPGYRVGSDGSVQSCVSPRTGEHTDHWRDLAHVRQGNQIVVSFGASSSAKRKRWSLRTLLVTAWGELEGQGIYARVIGR